MRATLLLALLLSPGPVLTGCASFTHVAEEKSVLPAPRLSRDAVVVEMLTVEMPLTHPAEEEAMWREVDEQSLPVELRKRLKAAGLRCGIAGNELPLPLQALLAEVDEDAQVVGQDGQMLSVKRPSRRRLQCREGDQHQLLLSDVQEELSVLWRDRGRIRGATYVDAQPLMVLRAFPQQSGQVRLTLQPQIHHGEARNRWVGRDGMFLMETGKERKVFDDLMMDVTLSPGEYLLVSSTSENQGLGERLFQIVDDDRKKKVLILRLAQTQISDLHGQSPKKEPLVTTLRE